MTVTRPSFINLGATRLIPPCFFPSVSSVKTTLPPSEYIAMLYAMRDIKSQFLVSAFDLNRSGDELSELLNDTHRTGITVLMDSGNYESYWKEAKNTWQQKDYHAVLQRLPCSIAFSFDEQSPPTDRTAHTDLVIDRWRNDQETAGEKCIVIPIIHGNVDELTDVCVRVTEATKVPMIAVAERRLGDGVLERVQSVLALRAALNRTGRYVGLHLLGTGNPISIAIYSWAGADSFDGLEWCQTVVDHDASLLYHLSQSDFFQNQTKWGEMKLSFHARTLAHNLTFYSTWMQKLRNAIQTGKEIEFFRLNFPERIFQQCVNTFGWDANV